MCGNAFDFVTLVSRPPSGTARKAYSTARSMPRRVKTEVWVAVSASVPAYSLPPVPTYSPSVFSRTISIAKPSRGVAAARHARGGG